MWCVCVDGKIVGVKSSEEEANKLAEEWTKLLPKESKVTVSNK